MPNAKFYGCLGHRVDVDRVLGSIRKAGGSVLEDIEAGTIVTRLRHGTPFRAMLKGDDVWICMYNKEFFPKPVIVVCVCGHDAVVHADYGPPGSSGYGMANCLVEGCKCDGYRER